jgi:CRISPR-associated endonuclease Csn1
MLEAEFDAIAALQAQYDPTLPALDRLKGLIFNQRPLKAQKPGVCTIDGTSDRAPWALPIVQRFRILQELNNLRLTIPPEPRPRSLDRVERDKLLALLATSKEVSFERMKKRLGLPEDARFNLESELRKKLDGDKTAAALASKSRFGKSWYDLPAERQNVVVERLIDAGITDAEVGDSLAKLGLDPDQAENVARSRLPQGHCHLGLPVIQAIVPIMEEQGLDYANAAREAGFHHSDWRQDEGRDCLAYYGETLGRWCIPLNQKSPTTHPDEGKHGRIANPTVHVGLNQVRKLVNAVIVRYGKPAEIHVELARDLKLGKSRLDEIAAEQGKNRTRNEAADAAMREADYDPASIGKGAVAENRRRYRLWLELDEAGPQRRCCPYTGRPIGIRALFSADVEIEHTPADRARGTQLDRPGEIPFPAPSPDGRA